MKKYERFVQLSAVVVAVGALEVLHACSGMMASHAKVVVDSGGSTGQLSISGTPDSMVQANSAYAFQPTAMFASGTTPVFAIQHCPSWAIFDTTSGSLAGVPAASDVATDSGIVISVTDGSATASLPTFSIMVTPAVPPVLVAGHPLVLYTDLISGPTSGGENGKGAYLSIFGKNFGNTGMGTTVKVYVGSTEVDNYRFLGASKGRSDVQQITVQVGALGNQMAGHPLPVKVTVNGVASNTDQAFTINPGRVLFVDNVKGNDATAVIGDIAHPFRHVQTTDLSQGAWGQVKPGDIMVMRGTGTNWADVGFEKYFMRYRDKSGSAPTGAAGTGAIVLMGYPTEDVFLRGTLAVGMTAGCISAINGQSFEGMGQWAVISNLRVDCEGYDGPISQEIHGNHWRVVNNDLAESTAPTTGPNVPRMAGITGNGFGSVWLGNHIHDVQGSEGEAHGIYIDGDGSYEIAYNHVENIRSGNGFQIYANGGNGSTTANNVNLHHNLIHDVAKHGINIADGSAKGITVYDNVVYNVSVAGVRFNTTDLNGAKFFNNTFYNCDTTGNTAYGILMNDWNLPTGSASFLNNVFWPAPNMPYQGGAVGMDAVKGTTDHNLFFGGTGDPVGTNVVSGDPMFVSSMGDDFHLMTGSAAIGAGVTSVSPLVASDYDLTARAATAIDIGAYTH